MYSSYECTQIRRKEEAADHAAADMARKVAALDQKDKSAAEKEQSLSSLTAELWAKASASPLLSACVFVLSWPLELGWGLLSEYIAPPCWYM